MYYQCRIYDAIGTDCSVGCQCPNEEECGKVGYCVHKHGNGHYCTYNKQCLSNSCSNNVCVAFSGGKTRHDFNIFLQSLELGMCSVLKSFEKETT